MVNCPVYANPSTTTYMPPGNHGEARPGRYGEQEGNDDQDGGVEEGKNSCPLMNISSVRADPGAVAQVPNNQDSDGGDDQNNQRCHQPHPPDPGVCGLGESPLRFLRVHLDARSPHQEQCSASHAVGVQVISVT